VHNRPSIKKTRRESVGGKNRGKDEIRGGDPALRRSDNNEGRESKGEKKALRRVLAGRGTNAISGKINRHRGMSEKKGKVRGRRSMSVGETGIGEAAAYATACGVVTRWP